MQIEEYRDNGQLYKIDTIEARENSFKYVYGHIEHFCVYCTSSSSTVVCVSGNRYCNITFFFVLTKYFTNSILLSVIGYCRTVGPEHSVFRTHIY